MDGKTVSEIGDVKSESAIIGTLICHPEFIAHSDYLKANYFINRELGCYYWAIDELFNKDGIEKITPMNLTTKLQSHEGVQNYLDKYNMPQVIDVMDDAKIAEVDTIPEYKMFVDNVVTLAFKRELATTLNKLYKKCFKQDMNLDQLNGAVYQSLDSLTQSFISSEQVHTLGDEIDNVWHEIESRRNGDGSYGIPSKFPIFQEYFTYEPGEMVVLQAKYKQGKSVFLMNEVVHKLKMGIPTLVYDSEMTTRLYTERLLSHLTGINIKRIKNGDYSERESEEIARQMDWLKKQKFYHIYDPGLSNERLYSICKMLKRKVGLAFVCYDYIKSNATSTSDNYNVLGAKCDFLKNEIAGTLNLPVLAACQLNRQNEVADSIKINMYLSVGIKWGYKTAERMMRDGEPCGNAYAKIYVNRLGDHMEEDDEEDFIDFNFDGRKMTITQAEQHHNPKEMFE